MEQANKATINTFTKGVNTDIAESLLPSEFLSSGHNIKFTNNDDKQGIVQKQESYIKQLDGYGLNLKPLSASVFEDVIYIVSYNTTGNYVEIGTYPSADLTTVPLPAANQTRTKLFKYAPLPNYLGTVATPTSGSFSINTINAPLLVPFNVDITYVAGPSGPNWSVTKRSGCSEGAFADITPVTTGTEGVTTLTFNPYGDNGATCIWDLKDVTSDSLLDTLTITIS